MTLVVQCAMCGTVHAVGTGVCSACRASGVPQLRLLFECPACGRLDITPDCEACRPQPLPYEVVEPWELDGLIACEVVEDAGESTGAGATPSGVSEPPRGGSG